MNSLKHILEGIKNQKPKSSVFIYVTVNKSWWKTSSVPSGVASQECQPWEILHGRPIGNATEFDQGLV